MTSYENRYDRREARIIVPVYHSDGSRMDHTRMDFERKLYAAFGGFTRTYGAGADPHVQDEVNHAQDNESPRERIHIYDVCINAADPADWRELRRLAEHVATWWGQVGVYVRWPHPLNHVSFVGDPDDAWTIPHRAREPEDIPSHVTQHTPHRARGSADFYAYNRGITPPGQTDADRWSTLYSSRAAERRAINRPWDAE